MHTLINYQAALNACLKDSASTGNLVGLRFLSSHLGYAPAIEQEDFAVYPALLT